MTDNFGINPAANIGDIVSVLGYGIRTFEVYAYTYEHYIDAENEYTDLIYEVTCTQTLESIFAGQEDISIVVRKGAQPVGKIIPLGQPKEVEKEPSVDDLLDELSDTLAMIERFGEHEDDEKRDRKYALKACEIKAKLRELTTNERT